MVGGYQCQKIWQVLDGVMDPEVPIISVVDLGIVRDVTDENDFLEVVITPTYSGCPATQEIENDIRQALDASGFGDARLRTRLAPAWTSDWITDKGRAALEDFGIAPPVGKAGKRELFGIETAVPCPHCKATDTTMVSEFGSTACKALWKCNVCSEPFDYFKCI